MSMSGASQTDKVEERKFAFGLKSEKESNTKKEKSWKLRRI